MYPTYILLWWHDDAWREIGWRASDPKSYRDLVKHAEKMSRDGDSYRIVTRSVYADGGWVTDRAWEAGREIQAHGAAGVFQDDKIMLAMVVGEEYL